MATARKLPSGSWRCLVYDYTDENGKRRYKSFTSNDPSAAGKRDAELQAARYASLKEEASKGPSLTVDQGITSYINDKSNVLSPSTIRGYYSIQRSLPDTLRYMPIRNINSTILQSWVNDLAGQVTPKTVRNQYALISAIIGYYYPDKTIRVQLPQKQIKKFYVPTDNDITTLIDYLKQHDTDMLAAVYLACFGTLRRSEICALTADDIIGCSVIINKAMVYTNDHTWITKPVPKNDSSNRIVELPDFVIDALPESGPLISSTPAAISDRFIRIIKRLNLPHIRFHDLRHYSASVMHAIGIPDVYIMQRGGWSSDNTLKSIYRGSMDDFARKYTDQTNAHFQSLNSNYATRNATRNKKNIEK